MWSETDEEVLDLLSSIDLLTVPAQEKARRFEVLAGDYPAGSEHRSACLLAAGEHRVAVGEYDAARRLFETARAEGVGADEWDAMANLLGLALVTGQEQEVADLARALLRISRERDLGVAYSRVGESFEEHDRLREAARWFSLANRDIDPDDVEQLDVIALHGRRRAREGLGLAPDRYDEASARLQADARDERD